MSRPTDYLQFRDRLEEVLKSDGKLCLPNIKEITDAQEALNLINYTSAAEKNKVNTPYRFRIRNFDLPRNGVQTHETCWYPKIFLNSGGMGSNFDGSGVILTSGYQGKGKVYTFAMCEHMWDESGANHSRGWHPKVCTKCGFDASIDSGD